MPKYALAVPDELYDELGVIATKQNISVAALIRRYMMLGLCSEKEPIYIKRGESFVVVDMSK